MNGEFAGTLKEAQMSNGTEPWEFGNTGGAGEPDPFLTYDPVQPCLQDLKEDTWESSVEEPTRSRLVKDKGPRIDTRRFAEPLKIEEEDNIPCDCGTCAEEKQPVISTNWQWDEAKKKYTVTPVFNMNDETLAREAYIARQEEKRHFTFPNHATGPVTTA